MNKLVCFLLLVFASGRLDAQGCANLNDPTAIADSCQLAPFLCGNYLDGYCGTNTGLTDDIFGQHSGFLRLAPCDDHASIKISVSDCGLSGNALIFNLYPNTCTTDNPLFSDTIFENTTQTLSATGLTGLNHYLLAVSGLSGSECNFHIEVVDGIGTALPGPTPVCSCSSSGIQGQDSICSYGFLNYSIGALLCTSVNWMPVGGNGLYCPPPDVCPSKFDSVIYTWHLPSVLHFVGDSIGPNILVALDTSYHGLDTILMDSIWVEWKMISTIPQDPIAFCACDGNFSGCSGHTAFTVAIGLRKRYLYCTLTCEQPVCELEGISYDTPGEFLYLDGECTLVVVTIEKENPTPALNDGQTICEGTLTLLSILNPSPLYTYLWSNGETTKDILISPAVTTTYTVTATSLSGACQYTASATVTVIDRTDVDLGQVGVLTCTEPCFTYLGTTYCQPGNYMVQLPQCSTGHFSIGLDSNFTQVMLSPVTICEGECFEFFGEQICSTDTVTHSENCLTLIQVVTVTPVTNNNLGVVGTISCAQPCFNFLGTDYCDPGIYTVQNSPCFTLTFEIKSEKDNIDLGEVGKITCANPCVVYDGVTYCQSGDYTLSDNCAIRHFSIGADLGLPVCSTAFPDCLPSNTHFKVSFAISGEPPYKVNGQPIASNYFLSEPVPNGQAYVFIVEQANGCQSVVSGTFDCAQFCHTDAGRLSEQVVQACANQTPAVVESIDPPVLASGDILDYTLRAADGTIITHNNTGSFNFDPQTMHIGEVYLAVLAVGPPDANGYPDMSNACTDTSGSQPIVFYALPSVNITGDTNVCTGSTITLTAAGADTYLWNDGATLAVKIIEMSTPANSGTYSVRGTDVNGCWGEDSVAVVVLPQDSAGCCKLQFPNAFTPNGDGANDAFVPILPDCSSIKYTEMRVYSRWGELVFQSSQIGDRWDGFMPNGSPASSDTYVFTFRYRLDGDQERLEKGQITLLR